MIAKRSQPQFIEQWARDRAAQRAHRGDVHRATRSSRSSATSRRPSTTFDERERASCTQSSFKAQFISGIIQPAMGFLANLNYVIVAVVGGLRVASGTMIAR